MQQTIKIEKKSVTVNSKITGEVPSINEQLYKYEKLAEKGRIKFENTPNAMSLDSKRKSWKSC